MHYAYNKGERRLAEKESKTNPPPIDQKTGLEELTPEQIEDQMLYADEVDSDYDIIEEFEI